MWPDLHSYMYHGHGMILLIVHMLNIAPLSRPVPSVLRKIVIVDRGSSVSVLVVLSSGF